MRLKQIKPFHFRAFTNPNPIILSDNLTIFYGGNGTGKSSLSEAIEWLFYGYTKRRKKGDEYSKNEYKGSYVNNSCPKGTAPYVEAEVKLSDGSTHSVRRTFKLSNSGSPLDQQSTLSVDGNAYRSTVDFSILGLSYIGAHCPVIVQHGIQDFIHTRPKDRYRFISEALGLLELVEFKDALEKAKNQRKKNPLLQIVQAKTMVTHLITKLRSIGLSEVAERWEKENFSVESDYASILEKACELSGSSASTPEVILKDVHTRQTDEQNKVFDITPFRPSLNLMNSIEQISSLLAQIKEFDKKYNEAAAKYTGVTASQYQTAQLEFWKQGLSLLSDEDPEKCPFCEEPTITKNKIQSIEKRLEADQELSQARSSFSKESDQYIFIISKIEQKLSELEFKEISDDDLSKLKKLIKTDRTLVEAFARENRKGTNCLRNLRDIIEQVKNSISNLKLSITRPDKILEAIKGVENIPSRIEKAYSELITVLKPYNGIFTTFMPVFERELSDESTVAKFTDLIDILNHYSNVRLLTKAKSFDNEIIEVQRLVDQYILKQQKRALKDREEEIFKWYRLLSCNEDVKFSGLIPGHNEFSLQAEAFKKTMNAAASLSHSQLNCLGLSIHIPGILTPDSPFKFILFDDPVQAMDDDHHESFLLNVVPKLMDEYNFQVIVLTHLKGTADRLREINHTKDFSYFNFDELQETGPVIFEDRVFREDIEKILGQAKGNYDSRKMAACKIRILCEEIMQETYFRHMGSFIPVKKGTASKMIPYFAKVPSVKPDMIDKIKDTIKWANAACHSSPGYNEPSAGDIDPHIKRLKKFIKILKLD